MPVHAIYHAHLLVCAINGHAVVNPCVTVFNDSSFDISFSLRNLESHFRVSFDDLANIRIVNKKHALALSVSTASSALFEQWANFFEPLETPDAVFMAATESQLQNDDNDDDNHHAISQTSASSPPRIIKVPCCPPLPQAAMEKKQIFVFLQMMEARFNEFRSTALPLITAEGKRRRASVSAARSASASVPAAREISLFSSGNIAALMRHADKDSSGMTTNEQQNNNHQESEHVENTAASSTSSDEGDDGKKQTQADEEVANNNKTNTNKNNNNDNNSAQEDNAAVTRPSKEEKTLAVAHVRGRRRSASLDARASSVSLFGADALKMLAAQTCTNHNNDDDDEQLSTSMAKQYAHLPPSQDEPHLLQQQPKPQQTVNAVLGGKKQTNCNNKNCSDDEDVPLASLTTKPRRQLNNINARAAVAATSEINNRSVSRAFDRSIAGAATGALALSSSAAKPATTAAPSANNRSRRLLAVVVDKDDAGDAALLPSLPPLPEDIATLNFQTTDKNQNLDGSKLLPHLSAISHAASEENSSSSFSLDNNNNNKSSNNNDDDDDDADEGNNSSSIRYNFASIIASHSVAGAAARPSLLARTMAQKQAEDEAKNNISISSSGKKKPAPKAKRAGAKKETSPASAAIAAAIAAAPATKKKQPTAPRGKKSHVAANGNETENKSLNQDGDETSTTTATATAAVASSPPRRATKQQTKKHMEQLEEKKKQQQQQQKKQEAATMLGAEEDADAALLAAFDVPTARNRTAPAAAAVVKRQTQTAVAVVDQDNSNLLPPAAHTNNKKANNYDDDDHAGDDDAALTSSAKKKQNTCNNNNNNNTMQLQPQPHQRKVESRSKVEAWIDTPQIETTSTNTNHLHNNNNNNNNNGTSNNINVAASSLSMQRAGSAGAGSAEVFQNDLRRLLTRDMDMRDVPDFLRLALDFSQQKHAEQSRREQVHALNLAVASVSKLLSRCADDADQLQGELSAEWRRVVDSIRAAIADEFKAAVQRKVQRAMEKLQGELVEEVSRMSERIAVELVAATAMQHAEQVHGFAERLHESQSVLQSKFAAVANKITGAIA